MNSFNLSQNTCPGEPFLTEKCRTEAAEGLAPGAEVSSKSIADPLSPHCWAFIGCQAISMTASNCHPSLCVPGAVSIPSLQMETLRLR